MAKYDSRGGRDPRGCGGDRSGGDRGGGGPKGPKPMIVLIPVEIGEKTIKVRAELHGLATDKLVRFFYKLGEGFIITPDGIKMTSGHKAEYVYEVPPNTSEMLLKVEVIGGGMFDQITVIPKAQATRIEEPKKLGLIRLLSINIETDKVYVWLVVVNDKGEPPPAPMDIHFVDDPKKGMMKERVGKNGKIYFYFDRKDLPRKIVFSLPNWPTETLEVEIPALEKPASTPTEPPVKADLWQTLKNRAKKGEERGRKFAGRTT